MELDVGSRHTLLFVGFSDAELSNYAPAAFRIYQLTAERFGYPPLRSRQI